MSAHGSGKDEVPKSMENEIRTQSWLRLLLILACLLPLTILFLLPGGGLMTGGLWFWRFLRWDKPGCVVRGRRRTWVHAGHRRPG